MNEFFLKYFVGLSSSTERKATAISLKLFYYLNCVILTIWITELIGYKEKVFVNDLDAVYSLITEYIVLVPVLILLSIHFLTMRILGVLSFLFSRLVRASEFAFMENKGLKEVFKERMILNENFEPGKNYSLALGKLVRQEKKMAEVKIHIRYNIAAVLTATVIYRTIIYYKFPAMYFPIIFSLINAWLIFILLANGLFVYIQDRSAHALAMLKVENEEKLKPAEKGKISLVSMLNLQFPKSNTGAKDELEQ